MLPGFVKFVRDRNASSKGDGSSGNGYNASSSRRAKKSRNTNANNTESATKIITLPGDNDGKGMQDHYYEMGAMDGASVSVSALIDHDRSGEREREREAGDGIMRTVHIRTEYVKA
jgi:hypothetical protein